MLDKKCYLCYNITIRTEANMEIKKITLKAIKENGGATLNCQGLAVSYKTGYQVSERDVAILPTYKLTLKFIKSLISPNKFVGVWIESGRAYIDISEHIAAKRHALELGKERNQISIYDWKNQKVTYC